jgi:hypothetical protein
MVLGAIAGIVYLIPKLIVALGAAGGLAFGGAAASAATVPWAVPVASAGLGLAGGTLLIQILVKATREATKEPYDWVVPILGILGGLILDVAKEYALDNLVVKIALSAAVAFLIVVAGGCYKNGSLLWRIVAVLLVLLPPIYVLQQNLQASTADSFLAAVRGVPGTTWIRIGGFVVTGLGVGLLRYLTR